MDKISIESYSAWFSVNTIHGSRLEFVLDNADTRKGEVPRNGAHVRTTYTEALWEMLKKEFEKSDTIGVEESCEYGSLMFSIKASSTIQLEKALNRCNRVTTRRINKFNINKMKKH